MFDPIVACMPIKRRDSRKEGVLVMDAPHDVHVVWAAITEPANLAQWLAPGEIDLRAGGVVKLDFEPSGSAIDSVISAFDPPWKLEYSWSSAGSRERPLCWRLEERPEATRIILSLSLLETDDAAKACAGWATHLEMLAAFLEGVPISFPAQRFNAYRAHLAAA